MILPFKPKKKQPSVVSKESCQYEDGFLADVSSVIGALLDSGYDPYTQLSCFLVTGNACFITRSGGARMLALRLDREQLRKYVDHIQCVV